MHVESTFSPDIIAALVSLQTRNYIYASVAAFWTYDYCLKWDEDYEFVFRTPWRSSKLLYLIARYSPFCLLAAHLYLNLLPNESVMTCTLLDNISSLFTALSMMSAECIFMLRAWALWGRSRRILCLIVGSFLLILALDMFVSFGVAKPSQIAPVPPEAQGSLTGCYTVHHDKAQMIPFAMIVVFELEVLALTFIRAVESYSQRRSELLKILLQHNVFYFSCGLVFSGVNIFAIMVFEHNYATMFQDFQIVMHAVLAARMHLALWSTERVHVDTPLVMPMSTLTQAEFATPTTLSQWDC